MVHDPKLKQEARRLRSQGMQPVDIAAKLGVNHNTVRSWMMDDREGRVVYEPVPRHRRSNEAVTPTNWLSDFPSARTWLVIDQATEGERALMHRLRVPGAYPKRRR